MKKPFFTINEKLAYQASDHLGYDFYKKKYETEIQKQERLNLLVENGFHPFSLDNRHKFEILCKNSAKTIAIWLLAFLIFMIGVAVLGHYRGNHYGLSYFMLSVGIHMILGAYAVCTQRRLKWVEVSVGNFKSKIPEHICKNIIPFLEDKKYYLKSEILLKESDDFRSEILEVFLSIDGIYFSHWKTKEEFSDKQFLD